MKKKIILDTDIGIDIDDTWALGFLLKCPELDVRLVTVGTGDIEYRAKIAAKFMQKAGFDVPIGLGIPSSYEARPQMEWVKDYDLTKYSGQIFHDGIGALIDLCNKEEEKITIICIGPLTNIAEALKRDPSIVHKANIISMAGSIAKGLEGKDGKIIEWNIAQNIAAAQEVFSQSWPIDLAPLDTCAIIKISGQNYQKFLRSSDSIAQIIRENYKIWDAFYGHGKYNEESSVLFDTQAVYMAFCKKGLIMEKIPLKVDSQGYFIEDEKAKYINCAVAWSDYESYINFLVRRLTEEI